ncbi:hypothetical protein LOD99_857 [Oopsacas minuta]|uniref:Uncharacterized protein n=1 Tax=Oopsacas minuta TaxID=111878 RepID=A0AAV7K2H0_9METZ|nr:hypothetical protein LOD99_857 [Oopsacas minuta]
MKILKISYNLSRTLQKQSISVAEGQTIAKLTVGTLKRMRTEESSILVFLHVERIRELNDTDLLMLPRKSRASQQYEVRSGKSPTTQMWKIITVTSTMKHWGLLSFVSLTALIKQVMSCTGILKVFLTTLIDLFYLLSYRTLAHVSKRRQKMENVSLDERVTFLRRLSLGHKPFFSEVCVLAHLILVMPATNAVSEHSLSAMRRLKTYLHGKMSQSRLNYVVLLDIKREE